MTSIIVVTWNREELMRRSFSTLIGNTNWSDAELIVVDNGSTVSALNYVYSQAKQVPRWTMIAHGRNEGIAPAWNDGLRAASGDVLILIASDCGFPPGWVEEQHRLLALPNAGCVGLYCDRGVLDGLASDIPNPEDYSQRVTLEGARDGGLVVCGGSMCFTRETHEKLGYLNEMFGLYGFEDRDWRTRVVYSGLGNYFSANVLFEHYGIEDSQPETNPEKFREFSLKRARMLELAERYKQGETKLYIPYRRSP